ncbi:MAG: phosphate ABC transporter substrate-binding protein PstS, partial [Thermoplasmata archaeon]|nr:phosphate ABC transporter substrate-binding protein PstS [Thermoplasmata archaeon]
MSGNDDAGRPAPSPAEGAETSRVVRRKKSHTAVYAAIAVLVVAVLVLGIGYQMKWFGGSTSHNPPGACVAGQTLQGNGAAVALAIVSKWGLDFKAATNSSINYPGGGSGTGITDLQQRTIDFAVTDDPLNASQQSLMPSPVLTLPVSGGGIVLIYNVAGLTQPLQLSGAVVADIFLGKITKWNDPAIQSNNTGVTLPSSTITTVHRQDAAGATFVLTDFLSQSSPAWAAGPGKSIQVKFPSAPAQVAIKGNSGLATEVQRTANTIGYVDLGTALSLNLAVASLLNPAGQYVKPTVADINSAINDKSAATTFPSGTGDWSGISMVDSSGTGDYPM